MGFCTLRRFYSLTAAVVCLTASLWLEPSLAHGRATSVPEAKAAPNAAAVAPYSAFYGVYVGGSKVGFMHATYAMEPEPTLRYRLEAEVRGMGRTTQVTVEETRAYNHASRLLDSLQFRQTADSGALTVEGTRKGKTFECITTAGGANHTASVVVTETLDDALAVYPMVTRKGARAGDHKTIAHFDAQAQAMTQVDLTIDKIQEVLVAGVATQMFTLTTLYKNMGVKEQSTVDGTGKLMASHMGGFFEARLEPEDVAKKRDLAQDMLLQAVVKAPQPLVGGETIESLTLTMTGFDDAPPPASKRQQVRRIARRGQAESWQLTLHKDAPLPPLPYPERPKGKFATEVRAALEPTAFVQSTAPDIVAAAREAVAGATTVPMAIEGLVNYVQGHLRAEYVPAFSNALEALHTGRGDCTEYSVLFVALARAAGIPARVAVGVAYWPPGEGFGWHAWAEVFANNRWISVDPTWGQTISDVTHLKFAEGGPSEQARVVMLLGKLSISAMRTP